jgi:Flp pilus assembly protein TadG
MNGRRHRRISPRRESGVIAILVGLSIAVLFGFLALVIDLGRLFVTKTELQSAVDSCALAAAAELDGLSNAKTRAINAGVTAGNLNRVVFQDNSAGITAADITISPSLSSWNVATDLNAKYVRCTKSRSGILAIFAPIIQAGSSHTVTASATAVLGGSQTECAMPIGMVHPSGGTASTNYGLNVGQWYTIRDKSADLTGGEMGWFNLDGSTNASETASEIKSGNCSNAVGNVVYTPGYKQSISDEWNARFGVYKGSDGPSDTGMTPDLSGWDYVAAGSSSNALSDFLTNRRTNHSANNSSLGGGWSGISSGQHAQYGGNRRIVAAPIISDGSSTTTTTTTVCYNNGGNEVECGSPAERSRQEVTTTVTTPGGTYTVVDYGCFLLLNPLGGGASEEPRVEFLGLASNVSYCKGSSVPGSFSNSKTPVLVE